MPDFKSVWIGNDKGVSRKIRDQLAPKTRVRDKVDQAIRELESQVQKLEVAIKVLKDKDRHYYNHILNALRAHDRDRAVLYANEIVELRKAIKSISTAKLAIEQISLRLETIKDVGDITMSILPAMTVLKNVKDNIAHILPQTEDKIMEIGDMLNKMLIETGQTTNLTIDFNIATEEAEEIMKVAEEQVEREMEKYLPTIPSIKESETSEAESIY